MPFPRKGKVKTDPAAAEDAALEATLADMVREGGLVANADGSWSLTDTGAKRAEEAIEESGAPCFACHKKTMMGMGPDGGIAVLAPGVDAVLCMNDDCWVVAFTHPRAADLPRKKDVLKRFIDRALDGRRRK